MKGRDHHQRADPDLPHGQRLRRLFVGLLRHPARAWGSAPEHDLPASTETPATTKIELATLMDPKYTIDGAGPKQCDHEITGVVSVSEDHLPGTEMIHERAQERQLAILFALKRTRGDIQNGTTAPANLS